MATTLEQALAYDTPPYENQPTWRKGGKNYRALYSPLNDVTAKAFGEQPKALQFAIDPLGSVLGGLFGGDEKKSSLKRWQKMANREWSAGNATLSAYERLFPRTLAMVGKAKNSYGDLELDLFNKYGNKYVTALDAADPAQAALRAEMNRQITEDLKSPGVTPSIARAIQQGSRAAWSSRGLAESPTAAIEELFAMGERGNALQQQKYGNAQMMMGVNKSVVGDPYLAITGRSSTTSQPDYAAFNNDLFSYGINTEMQAANNRAAKKAGQQAMTGQIVGGLLSSAGSLGALACWVAREVYGEENPKWRQFRRWLFEDAPARLRRWYLRHGAEFAAWLRENPEYKPQVRAWMEAQTA